MGTERSNYTVQESAQAFAQERAVESVKKGLFAQMVGKFMRPLRPILEFLQNPITFLRDFPMRYGKYRNEEVSEPSRHLPVAPVTRATPGPGDSRSELRHLANPAQVPV